MLVWYPIQDPQRNLADWASKMPGTHRVLRPRLQKFMTKMEQRLVILVPDPDKLEKFEALKKAYEHYKTIESLCFDEPEEDENK